MDDQLKALMQELGNAFSEALDESERIADAIAEIRRAGYDVIIQLELTIGFNKREVVLESDTSANAPITERDNGFLRALKISPIEEGL